MNLKRIKNGVSTRVFKHLNERRGWKTSRKIIVIESDDWGAIRMPDKKTYDTLVKAGIRVDLSYYNKYDTIASNEDFERLFEILAKYKDWNGRSPVITANTIVANPDFEKIRENKFSEYFYEPFTKTLEKYNTDFRVWQEGINDSLFFPQFHGREHLNVKRWLSYLKNGSKEVHFAFDNHLFGIGPSISLDNNPSFVQAFDSGEYLKMHSLENILSSGMEIFKDTFGFNSISFIAPNYIWNSEVEKILARYKVAYLQGSFIQKKPEGGKRFNYLGKKNNYNQTYLIRNVVFEPSSSSNKDWFSASLKEISNAFEMSKPAVICAHRVNFIGSLFEYNRTRNLKLLDELLDAILKKWPDAEFMTSAELGKLVNSEVK